MKQTLSQEAQELVCAGREASRPTQADKARVLEGLQARLQPPVQAPQVPSPPAGKAALLKVLGATGAAVLAGAIVVYGLQGPGSKPVETAVVEVESIPTPAARVSEQPDAPSLDAVLPGNPPASAPTTRTVGARAVPADRLAEEAALLARAEKAFHSGDLATALALAEEHRRQFSKGALVQERVSLRLQILCKQGREEDARSEWRRLKRLAPGQSTGDVCGPKR